MTSPDDPAPPDPSLDDLEAAEVVPAEASNWVLPVTVLLAAVLLVAAFMKLVAPSRGTHTAAVEANVAEPGAAPIASELTPTPAPAVVNDLAPAVPDMPALAAIKDPPPATPATSAPGTSDVQPPAALAKNPPAAKDIVAVTTFKSPAPVAAPPALTAKQASDNAAKDALALLNNKPEKQLRIEKEEEDEINKQQDEAARGMAPKRNPSISAGKNDREPQVVPGLPPKREPNEKADPNAPAVEMPPKPDPKVEIKVEVKKPICTRCLGSGTIPYKPVRSYVNMFGGAEPNPLISTPWTWCPLCHKDDDPKTLIEAEKKRLAERMKAVDEYSTPTGIRFQRVETHHITIYSELSAGKTRDVATALETLAAHLQNTTQRTILTMSRPDTAWLIITASRPNWLKLCDVMEKSGKYKGENWDLNRKSSGGTVQTTGMYTVPPTFPPEDQALFLFAGLQIYGATDNRTPIWLAEGFRAYCENAVTGRNIVYSFEYEMNDVKFGMNWNADIRTYAQQGKLKTWDKIFGVDLIGMKPLDYLTCYSMVSYLIKTDPDRFCKMVIEFKNGSGSKEALEKAYGRKITDLQMAWAQWALQQR